MNVLAAPVLLSSLVSIGVGSIVNGVFGQFTLWVSAGASGLLDGVGAALAATTAAPLNDEFAAVYALVRDVGAAMAGIFFMLALIRSILRQDLADLGRIVLIRLPLALVGAFVALQVVELAVQATDALSTSVLGATSPAGSSFPSSLASLLDSVGSGLNGGFELLVLGLLLSFVAFTLWVELVIRSSAIAIATLFIPLALTGAIWSSTISWARRLGEILVALIFSKIVVAGVFTLALGELGELTGMVGLVQGTALLVLATFAPWALFRLVPAVESGFVAHLDGLATRATRAAGRSAGAAVDMAQANGSNFVPTPMPTIPFAEGTSFDSPEFYSLVAEFEERFAAAETGAASTTGITDSPPTPIEPGPSPNDALVEEWE